MDETGIQMIPRAKRTLAPQGSLQVPGVAKKVMAQITKVTAISLSGVLLPYMLIYAGKTAFVTPQDVIPSPGSIYTATTSHFANARTTLEFVQKIIVPYVEEQRSARILSGKTTKERESSSWAVLIWDNFSAHLDADVNACLDANRIKSFPLPPNCTSRYQPLDVMFNGLEKQLLISHFSEWHYRMLSASIAANSSNIDVIPKQVAKKRSLIATLVRGVHEIMALRPSRIAHSWIKSTLFDGPLEINHSNDITEEALNNDILNLMLSVTSEEGIEKVVNHNLEDESIDFTDASDFDIHLNKTQLQGDDIEEDSLSGSNDDQMTQEEESDGDDSYSPPKRPCLDQNFDDETSSCVSISAESCQKVEITRPTHGGELIVRYRSSAKPDAYHLVELLKEQRKIPNNTEIVSVTNQTEEGFVMRLRGVQHGKVAFECPSFAW